MGTKDKLSASVDTRVSQRVDQYKERRDYETRSGAVEDLLKTGLDERESPILYRIKDLAIESAWYLGLLAVVSVVFGTLTDALHPAHGIQLAVVFLAIAAALVAGIELLRAANRYRDALPWNHS